MIDARCLLLSKKRYLEEKMDDHECVIADKLMEKYNNYEKDLVTVLLAEYKKNFQDKILNIPDLPKPDPKDRLKLLNENIIKTIEQGSLPGPKYIRDTLTSQPIPYDDYGLDLQYPLPE